VLCSGAVAERVTQSFAPRALITYGEDGKDVATHIAFWLGHGRILHSTQREDVDGVIEEVEPPGLKAIRRRAIRLLKQTELTAMQERRL